MLELLSDDAEATALLGRRHGPGPADGEDDRHAAARGEHHRGRRPARRSTADSQGISIGAITTLDELLESPGAGDQFPAIRQAIDGINSDTLRAQGTLAASCYSARNAGTFAAGMACWPMTAGASSKGTAVITRSSPTPDRPNSCRPSRIAPALIALGAQVRIIGPSDQEETTIPVEALFRIAARWSAARARDCAEPVAHAHPAAAREGWPTPRTKYGNRPGPISRWSAPPPALQIDSGIVRDAKIVLGQVAPTPWVSYAAAQAIIGPAGQSRHGDRCWRGRDRGSDAAR